MAEISITMQDTNVKDKTLRIINMSGQLDETNVDEEAKKIYKAIEEMPTPNMLLDFEGLTYINSKAIGYLTDWYSRVAAKNGKIAIVRPQANILDILKVVGITQIISIYDNMEEAKLAF
jgi:anti-anti-sigma factor